MGNFVQLSLLDEIEVRLQELRGLLGAGEGGPGPVSRVDDGQLAGDGLLPTVERRIAPVFDRLNLEVVPLGDVVPVVGDVVYLLRDFFTTELGSWEVGQHEFGLPQWARDSYLKGYGAADYFDDAGGDHHLFGAVVGERSSLLREFPFVFAWPDGQDVQRTKAMSGWANEAIYSKYNPERGEQGSWRWWPQVEGYVEVVKGASLPFGRHVSFFAVWQEVRIRPM